jgi:hypothetical protein
MEVQDTLETKNIQTITIDLRKPTMMQLPQFIQHDTNILEFVILENGEEVDLSNLGKIEVNYKRPDKFEITRLLEANGNKVTYEIGQEEMEKSGTADIDLKFYSVDNLYRISTKRFKVMMNQALGVSYIESKQLTLLQELFITVEELISGTSGASEHAQTQGDYAKVQGDYVAAKKADIDKFTSEQNNLQAQINTLVVEGDSSPAVAQARVNASGEVFPTLKARLDQENQEIMSSLADIVTVDVKSFGAKGDGVTPDHVAIRNAIEALPKNGGTLLFPPGTYLQGDGTNPSYPLPYSGAVDIGTDISFPFEGYKNFRIIGYGAIVQAHPNNSCIANNKGFEFRHCENGVIEGLTYDGSISTRHPQGGDPALYNAQSGFIIDSCKKMDFIQVTADHCVMDGFTVHSSDLFNNIDNWSEDITFTKCKARYNYRQGLSVVNAKRVKVYDPDFSYTGAIYGTSPMAGIDFEEGFDSPFGRGQDNCLVSGGLFKDNVGDGVAFHLGTRNSVIEYASFENCGIFVAPDAGLLSVNNTIHHNHVINASITAEGGGEHITGNIIEGDTSKTFGLYVKDQFRASATGKARKTIIENNAIKTTILDNTLQTGNYGVIHIGAEGVVYKGNKHYNVCSTTAILFVYATHIQFEDNEWIFDDSRFPTQGSIGYFDATITNFKTFKNNVIPSIYGYSASNMQWLTSVTDKGWSAKTFQVALQPDQAVDVTIPTVSAGTNGLVKVTVSGSWSQVNGTGIREEWFYTADNSRSLKQLNGNILSNGVAISDIYTKNSKSTITIKAPSHNNQGVNIRVEFFATSMSYVNPNDITMSSPYSYTSGATFRTIYQGGLNGTTANRPQSSNGYTEKAIGADYFDTSLGKPIWWNGAVWKDSTGTTV